MIYIIFYVSFLSIFVFLTNSFGVSVLNIDQQQLLNVPVAPPEGGLLGALTFLFELAVFGVTTFGFLVTVSSTILVLTIFVLLPLTAGFLWALIELARGN